MTPRPSFPCTQCGICCRHIDRAPQLAAFDLGGGVCRHLDPKTNLCKIYESRPQICRVEEMFEEFKDQ
jgi:Fe-S-cluster containining protein